MEISGGTIRIEAFAVIGGEAISPTQRQVLDAPRLEWLPSFWLGTALKVRSGSLAPEYPAS
jgi:hypothetical protein